MRYLLSFLVLVGLTGCGHHNDCHTTIDDVRLSRVAFDPVQYNPQVQIALFSLHEHRVYHDGCEYRSRTDVVVQNLTADTLSFNFVLSGPGWYYQNAVFELPPGGSESFADVTNRFYALDQFWLTIQEPVVYMPTGGG